MDRINIDTTQNVSIQYPTATTPERIGAYMLDLIIMVAYAAIISLIMGLSSDLFSRHHFEESENVLAVVIIFFLPIMFYSLLSETFFNGQSVGKMAVRIKVMRIDGRPPTFGNYLIRWLFRLIDVDILYGICAIITIAINGKGQRLGDMVAGTFVVKLKAREEMGGEDIMKVEELYIPVFAEVNKMTDKEANIIKKVLSLSEGENRMEMQEKLAVKLKEHLGITTEMEDNKFLRELLNDFNKVNLKS